MKEAIIYEFDPIIYPIKLWIAVSNKIKPILNKFVNWNSGEISNNLFDITEVEAVTFQVVRKEDDRIGVLVVFKGKKHMLPITIGHEASHVVDSLWEYVHEPNIGAVANAYLYAWVVDSIYKVKCGRTYEL